MTRTWEILATFVFTGGLLAGCAAAPAPTPSKTPPGPVATSASNDPIPRFDFDCADIVELPEFGALFPVAMTLEPDTLQSDMVSGIPSEAYRQVYGELRCTWANHDTSSDYRTSVTITPEAPGPLSPDGQCFEEMGRTLCDVSQTVGDYSVTTTYVSPDPDGASEPNGATMLPEPLPQFVAFTSALRTTVSGFKAPRPVWISPTTLPIPACEQLLSADDVSSTLDGNTATLVPSSGPSNDPGEAPWYVNGATSCTFTASSDVWVSGLYILPDGGRYLHDLIPEAEQFFPLASIAVEGLRDGDDAYQSCNGYGTCGIHMVLGGNWVSVSSGDVGKVPLLIPVDVQVLTLAKFVATHFYSAH